MAGSQIPTSVTILNSLHGFQAISLTEYTTSAACSIAAGSVCEIAGAFFTFVADEAINASSWTSIVTGTTAYITLTPSGTAGSQIVDVAYTSTAPTWRDDLQGWYASAASNVRVIGSVYKAEATNYSNKYIFDGMASINRKIVIVSSGSFICPSNILYITGIGPGGTGGAGENTLGTGGGDVGGVGGGGGGGGAICFDYKLNANMGDVISVSTNASGISILGLTLARGNDGISGASGGAGGAGGSGASGIKTGTSGSNGATHSSYTSGAGGSGANSYRADSVSGGAAVAPSWQPGLPGTTATEYGCGGGGGSGASGGPGTGSATGGAGGAGGPGLIIVEW